MSSGFDINFEGLDMNPDECRVFLRNIRNSKSIRSLICFIKTMDGTEDVINMIEEAREEDLTVDIFGK